MSKITLKKHLATLGMLFISCTLIWWGGEHLVVGDYAPLYHQEKRFLAIVFLFLAYLFKLIFIDKDTQPIERPLMPRNPMLERNTQILEHRLRGALNFLRKTAIHKNGKSIKLHKLPWYLLIGSIGSGKTTFLANSKVKFILDKQFKEENLRAMPQSETCDWWATRDLVIVDVPGSYITHRGKRVSLSNQLWQGFLELLSKWRGKENLGGVMVAMSVDELTHRPLREQLIHDLEPRIAELREKFGDKLPFYFVITKCDLLPGFVDFFGDCTVEELSQAWGVGLPPSAEGESLAQAFTKRFNALIKRLNQQLIFRLHQERNAYARIYIKDFPLQVEHLKDTCLEVIKSLTQANMPLALKGVYLTSAIQQPAGTTTHYPQTVQADEFLQALQIMHTPPVPTHAYFVRQFLLQGLAAS